MDMKKKDRYEDMTLLDKILLPFGIAAGLLGMGAGLMICFQIL